MSGFTRAAYVLQTRNLNGGVICKAADTLPFLLEQDQQVFFVPPTLRGPRTARVASVTFLRKDAWEVTFDEIDTPEQAEAIVGSYCLVPTSELPDITVEDTPAVLVGFAVEDTSFGVLGTVEEILENPAQFTLSVVGNEGYVLIPFVDEFIKDVNEEEGIITTSVPRALVDLNAKKGDE